MYEQGAFSSHKNHKWFLTVYKIEKFILNLGVIKFTIKIIHYFHRNVKGIGKTNLNIEITALASLIVYDSTW